MLALTDHQLATVQRHAEPLHPNDRGAYLPRVADLLAGCEVCDGSISRAARTAQAEFLRPPTFDQHAHGVRSKYR